ncbi:MAG: hypothetical protein AAFY64_07450 [Pseudomonadota bacterium]
MLDAHCYLMQRKHVDLIHDVLDTEYPEDSGYVPVRKRIWFRTRLKRR